MYVHADGCMCMADGVMNCESVTGTLAAFIEAFPPGACLLMQSKSSVAAQLATVNATYSTNGAETRKTFIVSGAHVRACADKCVCMPDGVMYWEDVAETLAAFIEAFPSGAALLMQNKGAMAVQLASVHDSLVPQVHASMASIPPADTVKVSCYFHMPCCRQVSFCNQR